LLSCGLYANLAITMENTPPPPAADPFDLDELLGPDVPDLAPALATPDSRPEEGPSDDVKARRKARNARDFQRSAKIAAAPSENPFSGIPSLPADTSNLSGILIGGPGRPKLQDRDPEATLYRNGRILLNPPVVEWLRYVGWTSAELTFPLTHPEGSDSPPTHFWLEKGGKSSPIIRYLDNGFAQYWQMGFTKRLRRAWPPGQWTTAVECSNDDTKDFPNMDFIRIPTHPKVHLRSPSFGLRAAPVPAEVRRVRKPQPGDVYANIKGKRRYILEAVPDKGTYAGKIVFSHNANGSEPITQTMLTFKAWLSIGGRLLTPEETAVDPLDDLL